MEDNHNTFQLWWLIVLFSLLSCLAALTLTDWGAIVAIVAAVIAVVILVWQIRNGSRNRKHRGLREKQKSELFKPSYQKTDKDELKSEYSTFPSEDNQRVHITLTQIFETYIEFVSIFFQGQGTVPEIKGLDDWHYEHGGLPSKVIKPYSPIHFHDERWYWEYLGTNHRFVGSRICIGIDYLATGSFVGNIVFEMSTSDGRVTKRLPFKVVGEGNA